MPVVRWPFRGLSEDERRAFMFTNVIDVKGRKYDIPVVSELWRRRGKSTAADRCHAEMGLSAGVFRRENIWSVPSSFGKDSSYEKLKPQDPWFGYNLGLWSDEDEAEAQAALVGDHYETGEKRLQQCVPVKKLGG